MKRSRICHISSVHPADDVRIFHKECVSLADAALWDVHLVGNGPLNVANTGVIFHSLPIRQATNRLSRMLIRGWQAYRIAKTLDADLYHIHDPELLPWAVALKISGKKIIYDAHEDVPRDILTKTWLPTKLRHSIASLFEFFENAVARRLDLVVAATPFIRDRFIAAGSSAVDINNYPVLSKYELQPSWAHKRNEVCYAGMITPLRGILEMCRATGLTSSGVRLNLCGKFSSKSLESETASLHEWQRIKYHGQVDRDHLRTILAGSIAGLVLFHECDNHVDAQPNKLFEYMSAGIPVIASDFPLWRRIIQEADCGLTVDPLNISAIAAAIDYLAANPHEAERLGMNGKRAVDTLYNWGGESKKLISIYKQLSRC